MITVEIDRPREMRFDYNALERINAIPKGRRGNRNVMELWSDANGADFGAMAILFWAANKHEDRSPEWTPESAERKIRAAIKGRHTTFRVLNEGLNDAMRESEALDLGLPPKVSGDSDGDSEGDEGNEGTTAKKTDGPRLTIVADPAPTESSSISAD